MVIVYKFHPHRNPHELHIDSNRNTKDIKIIKTAVENANLCGKICDVRTLLKCAKEMRQSHIRVKLTCLAKLTP